MRDLPPKARGITSRKQVALEHNICGPSRSLQQPSYPRVSNEFEMPNSCVPTMNGTSIPFIFPVASVDDDGAMGEHEKDWATPPFTENAVRGSSVPLNLPAPCKCKQSACRERLRLLTSGLSLQEVLHHEQSLEGRSSKLRPNEENELFLDGTWNDDDLGTVADDWFHLESDDRKPV